MWKGNGQDVVRIIKERLREMMPEARVWLDVDDLGEARGLAPQAVAPVGAAPQPGESREERTDSSLAAGQG